MLKEKRVHALVKERGVTMTRLSDLVETMLIKDEVMCVGDVQHNEVITETFSDVKSNKFNLAVAQYVKNNINNHNHKWYWHNFTKGQLQKLNAIMKAKSKETLQKRVYAFSRLITNGHYASLFNRKQIAEWVQFCEQNNLEHGLVKVDRQKEYMNRLNKMLEMQ